MKTDSIFYKIFQEFPDIFFELIGQTPTEANNYNFESVEIKQTAFRIDGVFIPTTQNEDQLIYFVEVQFQIDPTFYYRFLTEIFLFLGQNKPKKDWLAVAVFPQRRIDTEVPIEYQRLLATQQVQQIYLNELEATTPSIGLGIIGLIIEDKATAIEEARQLLQQAQTFDPTFKSKIVELIKTILIYKLPNISRQEIEIMFSLSDLKETKVYQEAKNEGKAEGKLEGKLESVPRLRAMGLSVEQVAAGLGLDVEVVRQVILKDNV